MKKIIMCLASLVLISCATQETSTKVKRSWTSPEKNYKGYDNLFIAVIINENTKKITMEEDIRQKLLFHKIISTTSHSAIRPSLWAQSDLDKDAVMQVVKRHNKEAIMTVSIVDIQNKERYIPGEVMANPMMMNPFIINPMMINPMWGPGAWGMGANFGGFWGMNHQMMRSPGHVVNDRKYFLEVNIYDMATEHLVWSAQSKTLNPKNLNDFSSNFTKTMIDRMLNEGVLRTP